MKITPRNGYVLVSMQEIVQEKKIGSLIIPTEDKTRKYLRLESDGEEYKKGECVFIHPFKSTKMEIEDNLFLIDEDDIVGSFQED